MKYLTAVLALFVSLSAQAWQPSKPVIAVVGFTPGGFTEIVFRATANQVEKNTGAKFVVLNKPGAGSAVANEYITTQQPDGHTILIGSTPALVATDRMLLPNKTYGLKDWTFATYLAHNPMALFTHPADPVNNIAEFINTVKNEQVTMGDPGSAARLTYELLVSHIKFIEGPKNVVRVEYKGPVDTVNDVMGRQIRFGIAPSLITIGAVQGGKLKLIALTGTETTAIFPGVQTMKSVFPDFDFSLSTGIVLPKDTPAKIVTWYETEFSKALEADEVKELLARSLGFTNKSLQNSKAFKAFAEREEKRYSTLVDKVITSH